jgi:hypothetical protein
MLLGLVYWCLYWLVSATWAGILVFVLVSICYLGWYTAVFVLVSICYWGWHTLYYAGICPYDTGTCPHYVKRCIYDAWHLYS